MDFDVEPLSVVSAGLVTSERVVLLADRPDFRQPYKFELWIPGPAEADRSRGLELLWARVVSIMAAVVGTSQLRILCGCAETFEHVREGFASHTGVSRVLEAFGPVSLTRVEDEVVLPKEDTFLPFVGRSTCQAELCGVPVERRVYVGLDFGRSDVKAAAVDGHGKVFSTHVTRWWRPEAGERKYLDPQALESHEQHLACLSEAALAVLKQTPEANMVLCGLGLSAAGCVREGHLVGVPPAFGGVDQAVAAGALSDLVGAVLGIVRQSIAVAEHCATLLMNDGDASAMYGAAGLEGTDSAGLFLSCGTGLAGGIVRDGRCCNGVLELGKLVMGLRKPGGSGIVPRHDGMGVEGAAQGLAGTQRALFNLLATRGGERIEGKAEQRAALVAMQKRGLDAEVRDVFERLGFWLAEFVLELMSYLPFSIEYVEAGGKLVDGPAGAVLLQRASEILRSHGVREVRRATDSEFGQAVAMAQAVRHPTDC